MAGKTPPPLETKHTISLTAKQRDVLIAFVDLPKSMKKRLEKAGPRTQLFSFTIDELDLLYESVFSATCNPLALKWARSLDAIQSKVDEILSEQSRIYFQVRRNRSDRTAHIYQLKIALDRSKPPIWRRIQVPDLTLGQLHEILQVVMGWDDYHLHEFEIGQVRYGVPEEDHPLIVDPTLDEEDLLLSEIKLENRKASFKYEYDFGDGWRLAITLEKTLVPETGISYPRCIAGARAAPPEDFGGIWHYNNLAKFLNDPDHMDSLTVSEMTPPGFDPSRFSIEEINDALQRLRSDELSSLMPKEGPTG